MADERTSAETPGGGGDNIPSLSAERLFKDHWADLVRFASRQLGEGDTSTAEDLAASVICSVVGGEFDGRCVPAGSALAFAKAVVRYRAMHRLRDGGRIHSLPDTTPDPRSRDSWSAAAAVRRKSAVRLAVKALPRNQLRAVVMFYFRDWSIADIAFREYTSEAAIRVRLSRARAALRAALPSFEHRL